jgi:hypothetical protein
MRGFDFPDLEKSGVTWMPRKHKGARRCIVCGHANRGRACSVCGEKIRVYGKNGDKDLLYTELGRLLVLAIGVDMGLSYKDAWRLLTVIFEQRKMIDRVSKEPVRDWHTIDFLLSDRSSRQLPRRRDDENFCFWTCS